ncbi:asparagine synthase-related protein [Paenibacillus sp. SI8]|uniref:asparagine synthase-related protein n=1 Tax=unclassified Paenibacillus TaxID=185978 RepID=UPI0034667361
MSAIAGIYHFNGESAVVEHGNLLMEALQHYPADQAAVWHKDNILLGCHAQWMTTESIQETLPYYNHQMRLAITADVILDNREELMDQLQVEHSYKQSMTDSQIILLAYQKWGEQLPQHLVGDFAFMIWDENKRMLFGARDFSGARTLYFHRNEHQFSFCTLIKPLFSLPHITKQLNEQWLAEFLAIAGVFEPPDLSVTVYKHIEQLQPSHTITVANNKVTLARYFSLAEISPLKLKSNEDYEEAFRDVFGRAVTSRLRTHRQVGAHLSGGLDSGSVVSFAARALRKENRLLHTFSYVPEDEFVDWTPKYKLANEKPLIQATVQHVGNINDNYLDFKGKSPLSEIDEWLDILEMPYKFFENSFWTKGIFEHAQQQGIGILLNGARGNYSISWGSAVDYYKILLKKLKWVQLFQEINQYGGKVGVGRKRIYSVVGRKAFPFLERMFPINALDELPQLINSDFAKRTGIYEKLADSKFIGIGSLDDLPSDPIEARNQQFNRVNMWSTTGTSSAKLSLRYSVWGHDPTNDLRVIRYCLSLPIEQFVQQGVDRALIRRSTEGYLPDQIRLNQRVRGIQAADSIHRMVPDWSAFIQELEQVSKDTRMQQIVNMPAIQDAIEEAKKGPRPENAYKPTIKLLMRSLIVHRFLQKNF